MIGYHIQRGTVKKLRNPLILLILFSMIITCIDPFNPDLKGITSILIVDALLTNENRSYTVEISRTSQTQNTNPEMVSWAEVSIKDNTGLSANLRETAAGIYQTDSLQIRGEAGNSYTLYIKTFEGTEYESDPCIMYPVQPIDSIYYANDQEFSNNGSEVLDGIRVFLDSENSGDGKYLRWHYSEWWEFSVPQPKKFDYINEDDIRPVDQIKQVCWGQNGSDAITIKSTVSAQSNRIVKEPILFIASDKSDRLLIQYCVEVKQLSLSKTEFEFWDQMQQINEVGDDIFQKQPFSIVSNIHNKSIPDETVLGYFQVSAVEQKRIYITPDAIAGLDLPEYQYDCDRVEVGPNDYPGTMTFDNIYDSYTSSSYTFIEPIYDMRWNLQKLVFTKPPCANCTMTGSLTKPDFWIDIEPPAKK